MKKYLCWMVLLMAVEISLAVYLTFWRNTFWDAVQARQLMTFCNQLEIFIIIALIICFVSSYSQYLGTMCAIKWREILNNKAHSVLNSEIENSNQRIQEDCREYPTLVVSIGFGVMKSFVYCIVFSVTLCYEFTYLYLLILFGYSIISTLIAKRIANPLIKLNYEYQRIEASYRNDLSKFNFSNCINIMLSLASKTKKLSYFQTFYGQLGVVIPICIIAPAYFSGIYTFGHLMQGQSIMGTILDNMSFGINSFNDINRLLSCRKRLRELGVL